MRCSRRYGRIPRIWRGAARMSSSAARSCSSRRIEGGGLIAVPGRCRLSLIRKLRPGEDLTARAWNWRRSCACAVADPADRDIVCLSGRARSRGRRRSLRDRSAAGRRSAAAGGRSPPSAGSRPHRRRAVLVGRFLLDRARHSGRLFRAGRHPHLPHTGGARADRGIPDGIAALAEFIVGYCGRAEVE